MRFTTIILALTLYATSSTKAHSLSKLHLSNASDTYRVQENEATSTVVFTNPKTKTPTLREIIYYHIIEKPFFGSNENDNDGPEFDDSTRPFTNAHSTPDTIYKEETDENIIDKESNEEEDLVTSSDEKLDDMEVDKDENNEQNVSESVDIDNESEKEDKSLIGVEAILNEDQEVVDENINTTEDAAIIKDDNIKANDHTETEKAEIDVSEETGLTEMELILNDDSEVDTETEVIQETSIEEITDQFDILEQNTPKVKVEEPRTESGKEGNTDKETKQPGDISEDKIDESTTLKTEQNEGNGTTKREIGGTKVNALENRPNVNYTRNTEILMSKRSRLFGSPEQLKERAMKMKNIMPSVRIRQPEVNRRQKRDVIDDIPEGPTLPELDYSTLPEYVRSLIPTTEKTLPSTKSIENPKHKEDSQDAILSTDMEDRLKNILNQIKPLLAKSVSDNDKINEDSKRENDKDEKSDDDKIKKMFKGRTYGMNLNSGRGSVWNDIINDNGNHVQFGDSIPEDAQEHLNFYHDEAYSDEDDIRREIIKRIQEIFANTDKNKGNGNEDSAAEGIIDDGEEKTEVPKAIEEKAAETSDKVDEINNKNVNEKEATAIKYNKMNHSPDKHEDIAPKLITIDDDPNISEDENSSSDNNHKKYEKTANNVKETPIEIPEDASDAEFVAKLRQGRTYGMSLTDDKGVVWNDLFTKPGVRIHVGEESTDEQLSEENNSEQLEPFDSETASDDDDIYVKVDKKKPSKDTNNDTTKAKSHLDAKDTDSTKPIDDVDSETKDPKDIDKQNDENDPEINTKSSAQSDVDVNLISDTIAAVIGLENDEEQPTEAELHTNKDSDEKEKFWKWMTQWTTAYTQLLTGFIDDKISDAISDFKSSMKPANSTEKTKNPENIEMVAEKEPNATIDIVDDEVIPVNDTDLLRRRKEHKKIKDDKVAEVSKGNSTENLPNVTATTIYGNAVGNNKVTNIFVFLTERNASLNFVQDIIKDGDKIIGDDIKPNEEDKENINEGVSANKEQSKPEISSESTENVTTESVITQDVEDKKDDKVNQEPTEPKKNKVVDETSNHENITTIENKEVDKSSEINSADKVPDTKEIEKDISKTDNTETLTEPVKEDIAANAEEPETNTVNNEIAKNSTVSEKNVKKPEVSEDNKKVEDSITNSEESEAKTNKVIEEKIIDNNNKTSEDIQSETKPEETATNTDAVANIDIENPNVNLTDVQVSSLNNENEELTTISTTELEKTTDSIESATLA